MLAQVFEERGKADPSLDLTDLGNTLMNDSGLPIDGEVTPVEPGLLMGFGNDEITGLCRGGHVRPRHRHHSLCGLSFPPGCGDRRRRLCPDIEGPGQPRWNICTEADETVVRREGDVVFFVMCPSPWTRTAATG